MYKVCQKDEARLFLVMLSNWNKGQWTETNAQNILAEQKEELLYCADD